MPDLELDGLARLAGTLSGGPASMTIGSAPSGSIPLRGGDGEVRGGLCVEAPVDDEQRAALDQLAAHAGALLERRDRETGLLDAVGALLRTNDELAVFAGRVAHDLRSPLTAVLGFLALADGPLRGETSERAAECVRSALTAATRMRVLVDDLLAYATFTARPELSLVDMPALVRAVGADLGADGRVGYVGADRVCCDPTLVRQLVQNLVGNALTHAGPAPRIAVSTGLEETTWWLRVADDGPGIPPAQRERVFDPFVRLGRTAGSGLGLATCARIAEALGGRIAVGDAPEGGAAFTATFPR
ncbi:MAG TPA: HAMP domain-containing sensor histidine kinase [Pseudonocardia sp.]